MITLLFQRRIRVRIRQAGYKQTVGKKHIYVVIIEASVRKAIPGLERQ